MKMTLNLASKSFLGSWQEAWVFHCYVLLVALVSVKRNSSQSLVPVDPDGQMGFVVRAHPHQTETLRDADLDHQSQRITRLLMRWCLCLPAKNLSSSFLQDAEISAFELRNILNKILAKRKYLPPAVLQQDTDRLPVWLWEILSSHGQGHMPCSPRELQKHLGCAHVSQGVCSGSVCLHACCIQVPFIPVPGIGNWLPGRWADLVRGLGSAGWWLDPRILKVFSNLDCSVVLQLVLASNLGRVLLVYGIEPCRTQTWHETLPRVILVEGPGDHIDVLSGKRFKWVIRSQRNLSLQENWFPTWKIILHLGTVSAGEDLLRPWPNRETVETVSLSGRRGLFISIHLSASVLCPSLVQNQNYL